MTSQQPVMVVYGGTMMRMSWAIQNEATLMDTFQHMTSRCWSIRVQSISFGLNGSWTASQGVN